jgi:subtilase family serine protease
LSTLDAASQDTTLTSLVTAATARDPATIWALTAGGLTTLPSSKNSAAYLIETVWNGYSLVGNEIVNRYDSGGGYNANEAGAGGVDPNQPQPSYQTDYGLNLTTSDPSALPGRGVPDVAALAGGNLGYNVPTESMTGTHGDGGTSASAPLWAALVAQFNALFRDQELPQLGYMNDLLYIAAAIAPAAFNDVTLGNNTSSFSLGGSYLTPAAGADGNTPVEAVTPTGYGYSAGPGYDLTTGLGTPNGLLLARALTTIQSRIRRCRLRQAPQYWSPTDRAAGQARTTRACWSKYRRMCSPLRPFRAVRTVQASSACPQTHLRGPAGSPSRHCSPTLTSTS